MSAPQSLLLHNRRAGASFAAPPPQNILDLFRLHARHNNQTGAAAAHKLLVQRHTELTAAGTSADVSEDLKKPENITFDNLWLTYHKPQLQCT